jgi:signal transduction histidine kinase/CheY-like chemotaxis protein
MPTVTVMALRGERDVVQVRQRARELASLLGFDNQDQIRIATATSEMARNAFRYARNGKVEFSAVLDPPQSLKVCVTDSGPGISNLDEILEGRYRSQTGLGMGIIGTRRLMDEFSIDAQAGGTTVEMQKYLPIRAEKLTTKSVALITEQLLRREPESPFEEVERQNQELLKTLQELRSRQEELTLLNRELEDTNRGVVALYAELDERADYLRRASELKTKFLSNVSHEFRTPLNSIISLARLLLGRIEGELTHEQERQVQYIESSARDLQEMVNDLLDLAKVEAGKIKIRPKSFEVHELFSALKGMLKPLLAGNTSVELVFEAAENMPPLFTDEGKVSQILRNLISNALKFTPRGKVTVSAMPVNGHVRFEVADTGIGISPEHFETVFMEFSQIENPLQERHRGTGLGLPLCRNLAALLGGKLWLESELGKGSCFFTEIPAVYAGELSPQENSSLPAPEFHRAPILIVEDDAETAHLYEAFLRQTEFQPIIATGIAQAQTWIARHTPDAIVLDVYLDGDASWRFLTEVKDKMPSLPIVSTSVHDERLTALAKGASTFLLKPLEREILLAELRRLTAQVSPRRLLIVDDNEVSRYILRELLDRPWLTIEEVNSGTEAVRILNENPPDALILDLLMPDMSGLDVLKRLRERSATQQLPVVVYTSKVLSDLEKQSIEQLEAAIIKKEDVSNRLSAKPFFDWLHQAGIVPQEAASKQNV